MSEPITNAGRDLPTNVLRWHDNDWPAQAILREARLAVLAIEAETTGRVNADVLLRDTSTDRERLYRAILVANRRIDGETPYADILCEALRASE